MLKSMGMHVIPKLIYQMVPNLLSRAEVVSKTNVWEGQKCFFSIGNFKVIATCNMMTTPDQ